MKMEMPSPPAPLDTGLRRYDGLAGVTAIFMVSITRVVGDGAVYSFTLLLLKSSLSNMISEATTDCSVTIIMKQFGAIDIPTCVE